MKVHMQRKMLIVLVFIGIVRRSKQHRWLGDAAAGKLLLGHYSARYGNEQQLLDEAKEIFPNTFLTQEGTSFDI